MTLLRDASVCLKFKKYEFFTSSITYLRHVIRTNRQEKGSHAPGAMQDLKPPATVNELEFVLNFCNVFQQFVPIFTHVSVPLNRKLRGSHLATFGRMSQEETTVVKAIRHMLISPPVLPVPRCDGIIHWILPLAPCNLAAYFYESRKSGPTDRLGIGRNLSTTHS